VNKDILLYYIIFGGGHSKPNGMRPIATDGVAWSVCLCVSVSHEREPCKNGGNDRDAVWDVDAWAVSQRECILWAPDSHMGRGTFDWGHTGTCPAVDILKMTHKKQHAAIRPARHYYHGHLL